MENKIIISHKTDNVAIVVLTRGLKKNTPLNNDLISQEPIPMGHKIALQNISKGAPVIRYGHSIGIASTDIKKGEWVNEHKISLPKIPDMRSVQIAKKTYQNTPLKGYTFLGYRNADGSVGTKNILAVTASVQCVAGFLNYIVRKIKHEILPKYPNVDDVVAINHAYGCGVAIDAPSAVIPIRTIQNITTNPNFGGEVLVVGLGCEKLRPESLLLKNGKQQISFSENENQLITTLQNESMVGFESMANNVIQLAELKLQKLNKRKRERCPVSDLVVGIQCGGSDAFSGITANAAAGFAADLIVRAGGSVLFSEVSEVRDAVHLLLPRAASEMVREKLINEMLWFDDYLEKGQATTSANPAPGNKKGGLSNIVEKALGSIVKSGKMPIADVVAPGEKIKTKGLNFVATPASDFVCGTLQLAAGMNMHVFTTGRGTPYGLQAVPVIKMATNSKLGKRWFDLIDFDAGQIATGQKTVDEMGWELFSLILEVASGKKQVASDKFGLYNDLVLFNPGPVT